MAEKQLNTRILLKYDSLTNWNKDLGYLRKGEVAIATVTTDEEVSSASKLTGGQPPQVLIKVGDGSHKFSELPYITAKAGDVYSWAKEKTLKYEALPEELKDKIVDLESAIGQGGSVQVQIENAIKDLDVTDVEVAGQFVVAVPETDGKVAPARRALVKTDIPVIDQNQINGLPGALSDLNTAIENEASARETAVEGAKTHAEGLVNGLANGAVAANTAAIAKLNGAATEEGSIAKVLADAKAYAESEAADAEAAAKAHAEQKATAAETAAKGYVDQKVQEINGAADALEGRVKANEDAIKVINGAATVEGSLAKVAADAAAAVAAEAKRAGDKEAELGEAIATEKGRIDAFFASAEIGEAAIDTLKEIQAEIASDNEGAAAMAASIQQNKEAIEAEVKRATAKEDDLAQDLADEVAARDNADKAHTEAINGINTKIGAAEISNGKGTLIEAINANSAAIETEKGRAEAAEASLLAKIGAVEEGKNLAALIAANTKAISDEVTARDNADKQHTADIKAINEKVGAETLTLGGTLISAINANTAAIAAEEERALAAEAKALSDAKAHAEAKVKELADGQVKANADAIAAINGNANIVKKVKFENVSGKTPNVLTGEIANNELTVKFDDSLTFILDAGNADAKYLDATAQG